MSDSAVANAAAGTGTTLTIVIPVYNEHDTWRQILQRVQSVELPCARQIVLVDDCSRDGTRQQLEDYSRQTAHQTTPTGLAAVKVLFHEVNQGKGAALRTGFAAADGDIVVVQDADLEYDPADYPKLLTPLLAGAAEVAYGSRYAEASARRGTWQNYLANRFLTTLSNLTTGLGLTDMETCYKMFRRSVLQSIHLEQSRFGFEPEVTAKVARLGVRVVEVPISYHARSREQGKKIGWRDGLKAVWCILKYGLFRR
ncbi:MAG: glycosyltransferase family 2 protein [Phycisphaerae bacterium]|nr:glycosyltransferase family 2 protein [Phycisphaerae bacterium]